jgi:hypothetical protein
MFSLCILLATCAAPLQEQPPTGPEVAQVQEAAPVRSTRQEQPSTLARQVLAEKEWGVGYNAERQRYLVIGEAPIAVKPGDEGWPQARAEAYANAMLAAKRELATFLGAEISRRTGRGVERPDKDAAFKAARARAAKLGGEKANLNSLSLTEKVTLLAHQEIDKFIDEDKKEDPAAMKQAVEAVVLKKEFSDRIDIAASAETAGLASYQTFESNNSVAVIAMFTEGATYAMARAILGQGTVKASDKTKEPVSEYCRTLESSGALMYTNGVRLRTDENGDLNLVSFAHAPAEYDDGDFIELALEEAALVARGQIRSFAGELLENSSALDRASTTEKVADEARKLTTRYKSKSSYDSSVKSTAAKLRIPGSALVYDYIYQHPDMVANNDPRPMVCAVVTWNVSAAESAAELGAIMGSLGGSLGGDGFQAKPKGASNEKKAGGTPGKGGRGAGGDDDDFGG